MSRFVVVECHGWLTDRQPSYKSGLSITVIDDLTGREHATYRTEDHRGMVRCKAEGLVRQQATEHAARLEAEYGG